VTYVTYNDTENAFPSLFFAVCYQRHSF